MTYIDLVKDERFNSLVEKYLGEEKQGINYREYFDHFIKNLDNNELIIPVLGIQGAGKSSFLNSILMEENVLPTDVDETTCVPVEVRYGNNINEATVFFLDESSKNIKIEDLEKYVHNDYNPANELGISKIVLYNKSEILKGNITLVDLPGVGSLTPENQKTTIDYVNKLVAGIFMIRTNPPITRTEKNFINALWPKLSNTLFVQNKWNDETFDDAQDAKEHNEGVLTGISYSHGDNKDINVDIVNVYDAVRGKFTQDSELYNKSGINKVIEKIRNISVEYNENLVETLNTRAENILETLNNTIENYKILSLNETKQNELEKEKKVKEIKQILYTNKNDFRKIRTYAYEEMDEIILRSSEVIRNNIENLRAELKRIINRGIVDGEILSSVYKEVSDKTINNIMEEILSFTGDFVKNLNSKIQYITIKGFDGTYENISFFNKRSSFKFEKSIPSVLGLSSGVIGTLGVVGSLGGPLGVLVGMGIGLVFSIIGDTIRKEIIQTRANYTIKDLEPMIEDLENYLKEEILDDLRAKQQEVDDSIRELRKGIEKTFKDDIESIEKQYEKNYNEDHTIEFEEDLKLLSDLRKSILN